MLGVARSSLLARTCAPLRPADEADVACVDHLGAVAGWSSTCLIEPLRLGVYDVIVLGSMPRGRLACRRLRVATQRSGTLVLVGDDR